MIRLLLVLISFVTAVNCSNILYLLSLPSPSHHVWFVYTHYVYIFVVYISVICEYNKNTHFYKQSNWYTLPLIGTIAKDSNKECWYYCCCSQAPYDGQWIGHPRSQRHNFVAQRWSPTTEQCALSTDGRHLRSHVWSGHSTFDIQSAQLLTIHQHLRIQCILYQSMWRSVSFTLKIKIMLRSNSIVHIVWLSHKHTQFNYHRGRHLIEPLRQHRTA